MPKTVLIDEWHLTSRIPARLSATAVRVVSRVLTGRAFTASVRRAVLAERSTQPALKPVRVTLTR